MKRKTWMLVVGIILDVAGFGSFLGSQIVVGILFSIAGIALILLYVFIPSKPVQRIPFEFKVAGVSYRNDDGTERQDLIKEIKAGKQVKITISPYQYNGKPAFGVYADGKQLGNVPSDLVDEIQKVYKPGYTVTEYKVLGSGQEAPFGFLVKIQFAA